MAIENIAFYNHFYKPLEKYNSEDLAVVFGGVFGGVVSVVSLSVAVPYLIMDQNLWLLLLIVPSLLILWFISMGPYSHLRFEDSHYSSFNSDRAHELWFSMPRKDRRKLKPLAKHVQIHRSTRDGERLMKIMEEVAVEKPKKNKQKLVKIINEYEQNIKVKQEAKKIMADAQAEIDKITKEFK